MKQLKSDVAALERKIQLASPKPEAVQEQQADGRIVQTQSPPTGDQTTTEQLSDAPNQSQIFREHVQIVKLKPTSTVGEQSKGIKM